MKNMINLIPGKLPISVLFSGIFLGILGIHTCQAGEYDGNRAYQFLIDQTQFGPRVPGTSGHAACLEYLADKLDDAGAVVSRQPFMHYNTETGQTVTMTNLIGSFYPEKMNRILLCAHWDSRPFADQDRLENRDKPILGANDGASGVAALLELALYIQTNEPPVGIDIIFFDGEDSGKEGDLDSYCLGSRYFTQNNRGIFPRFAILLDMIGDAQLQIAKEGYSQQYAPDLVNRVWDAAERSGTHQFLPELGHYVFDDHVVLNEAGIPAIDIIDFEYPDASHRYWHTLQDTADKCSPESLQAVGNVLVVFIFSLEP